MGIHDDEPMFTTFMAKRYKPQERERVVVEYPELDDPVYEMSREEIAEALKAVLLEEVLAAVEPHRKFETRGKAIPVIHDYLYKAPLSKLTQHYVQARHGRKVWSTEELKDITNKFGGEGPKGNHMDNSSMALHAEEERLLSAANRMKTKADMGEISKFVNSDCRVEDPKDRENIINRVMRRVGNTESGHSSGAMGKGHDPNKQLKRISDVIKSMRAF